MHGADPDAAALDKAKARTNEAQHKETDEGPKPPTSGGFRV